MSILLRPPHFDKPFMWDSTEHYQRDKKNRKNVRALKNKEKHGIFKAALLCRPAGKFWIILPSSHSWEPVTKTRHQSAPDQGPTDTSVPG